MKSCSRCILPFFKKCPKQANLQIIIEKAMDFIDAEMEFRKIASVCECYFEFQTVIYKTPQPVKDIYI